MLDAKMNKPASSYQPTDEFAEQDYTLVSSPITSKIHELYGLTTGDGSRIHPEIQ